MRWVVTVVRRREGGTCITVRPRNFISSLDVSAGPDAGNGTSSLEHREFAALELGSYFPEDIARCARVRMDSSSQNLAILRNISHYILKRETRPKVGIPGKRPQVGWGEDYLLKVLLS